MNTAKLNAVGHRWVGELADVCFEVRYQPEKINTDADTLCRLLLDTTEYVATYTRQEELSKDMIQAT